jgi:hypothetical protein
MIYTAWCLYSHTFVIYPMSMVMPVVMSMIISVVRSVVMSMIISVVSMYVYDG